MIIFDGKYTKAKVMIDQIDESCSAQITQFINHPAFTNPVTIMPDCHAGKGSVIGFTMEMTDRVIPNTIGVDIGCGMLSTNLGEHIAMDLKRVDEMIREAIPFGFEVHESKPLMNMEREFPWRAISEQNRIFCMAFNTKFDKKMISTKYDYDWFLCKCDEIDMNSDRASNSLGTLGGGNHFIEIGESRNNKNIWLTVHTGSRQLGERICRYWQNAPAAKDRLAAKMAFSIELNKIKDTHIIKQSRKKIPDAIKELKEKLGLDRPLKSKELDYLKDANMEGYLTDMMFAQMYASVNRQLIANKIIKLLNVSQPAAPVNIIHNYISFADFIIRKGAISSYKGQVMIIPLNMRDGLLICKGKGNSEWNYSAPHGAGRVLSRSQAKAKLDLEKFQKQMRGVFSTSIVKATIDEAPDAYKDSKVIEAAIEPTAEIIDKVIPIHNLKDSDEGPRYGARK